MAQCARLTRKAAAGNGCHDVILGFAFDEFQRLVDHELKHRACKIGAHFLAVDDDAARARLDPDARNRVLALAGRIGAAMGVKFLNIDRGGWLA